MTAPAGKWPKRLPPLTPRQQEISDDFMRHWHGVLSRKMGFAVGFSHRYPVRHSPPGFLRTLEIGAGDGEHLRYERLTPAQEAEYYALELRENMASEIGRRGFPGVRTVVGDCQDRLPFPDGTFDRVLAIHVLEHLPRLPDAIREAYRVLDKARGVFLVVLPCEGGAAYSLARRISAQRVFEKRYGMPYGWLIAREHLNRPAEVVEEAEPYFQVVHRGFFPLPVPAVSCNITIGLTLRPRRFLQRAGVEALVRGLRDLMESSSGYALPSADGRARRVSWRSAGVRRLASEASAGCESAARDLVWKVSRIVRESAGYFVGPAVFPWDCASGAALSEALVRAREDLGMRGEAMAVAVDGGRRG